MPEGWTARANSLEGSWESAFPNCSREHLFEIASGIEAYPGFIPGCVATRIVKRSPNSVWTVDNIFGFGPIRTRFMTTATLDRPNRLDIVSSDGPWKDFFLAWKFAEHDNQAKVTCRFAIEFRSALLNQMAGLCVPEIERQVIAAFEKRVMVGE